MRTDSEPNYVFSFKSSKNAIANPDAGRVNAIAVVQFLEVESRMAVKPLLELLFPPE